MYRTSSAVRALTRTRRPLTFYHPQFRRYHNDSGHQHIQTVKFASPRYTTRRLAIWALKTAIVVVAVQSAFGYFFKVEIEETEEEEEEVELQEGEGQPPEEGETIVMNDGNLLFIPLGPTTQLPKTFYKGSDPEWQDFKKLAADRQKLVDIRRALAYFVRTQMMNDPRFKMVGQVDVKKGKFWLDVVFPDGPAPEYEQTGLVFAPNYIAWAARTLSQEEYRKRQRIFMPVGMLQASYDSFQAIYQQQIKRFRGMLSAPGDPSDDADSPSITQKKRRTNVDFERVVDGPPRPNTPRTGGLTADDANDNAQGQTPETNSKFPRLPGVLQMPGTDDQSITRIFRRALTVASMQDKANMEAPRGTVVVTGLVETIGTNGRSTIDTVAFYDPRTDRYVHFKGAIRTMMPLRQGPRGGE
ncbi:hypothetical protein P152DRAFT_458674 [Eremomyces bilateralis CBS 781.70]|uniref:Uncharacterized protein n=1 Tax=Eremomyces bilateralis CBS 781.70 TaxID=1392243 RepID=A0A6G1G2P5_9PEZI|nr:uncharacterized protein P152DRAFT_458674 [Eremomyces bilateralis CBS 781.70]KAF1812288.1 hypothetical protein P152DRAFT_458674 [Eremomyces bilateralis CBS 781.70]